MTDKATLPTDAKARKNVPVYSGVLKYFPRALAAVAELSRAGNEQHNPGKPLFWDRSKSGDELDALTRHLLEAGTIDTDGQRHSAKVAWRALANLEKELEQAEVPITMEKIAAEWADMAVTTPKLPAEPYTQRNNPMGCHCDSCTAARNVRNRT